MKPEQFLQVIALISHGGNLESAKVCLGKAASSGEVGWASALERFHEFDPDLVGSKKWLELTTGKVKRNSEPKPLPVMKSE